MHLLTLLLSALLLAAHVPAHSQTWPARPIRILNGGGPGSPLDIFARGIAQRLGKEIKQTDGIEKRPGANQLIVAEQCSKAAPDGYTLCMVSQEPITNNPYMFKSLPYDVEKGFTPIAMMATPVAMVLTNAQTGVKTLSQAVALSKSRPGTMNWGSYGIGSASHLYLEGIRNETAWDVTHVPFTDPTKALTALLRNDVQFIYTLPNATVKPHLDSGALVPVLFAGSPRHPRFPDVQTFDEAGLGKYFVRGMWSLLGPAGLPSEVVQRVNRVANEVIRDPELDEMLTALSLNRLTGTPDDLADSLRRIRSQMGPAFARANVQPN